MALNRFKNWTEEKDYTNYPVDKMCDMDFMAIWIRSTGYEIQTDIKNLINNIINGFQASEPVKQHTDFFKPYYALKDNRPYPECVTPFIPDYESFVKDNGGMESFDRYIESTQDNIIDFRNWNNEDGGK